MWQWFVCFEPRDLQFESTRWLITFWKLRQKTIKEAKKTSKPCNLATTLFPLQLGLLKTQSTGGNQAGSTMQPVFFFRLGHRHLRSVRRSSTHRFGSGPLDRSSAGPSHLGQCLETLSANERLGYSCAKNGLFELAGYLSSRNKNMFWTLDPFFWGLFLHGHLPVSSLFLVHPNRRQRTEPPNSSKGRHPSRTLPTSSSERRAS